MRPVSLPIAIRAALAAPLLLSLPAPAAPATDAHDLEAVIVTATRTARPVEDVPQSVDVIERARFEAQIARDLKDLFRYEPGISVPNSVGRFGLQDIRIRGLGGNRVLIQTDGVPVSDAFAIGSFSNANRNFVDLDTLKRVEVLRGPGSSLYGSDALGGVVAFITKDPADYLGDGKDAAFGLKLGYDGETNGLFGGATAAVGGQRWSALVAASHRQGRERENQGDDDSDGAARTAPNPQSYDGRSLLAKLVFDANAVHRIKLTVDANEDAVDTDVRTGLGFQALTRATTTALQAADHQTRARVSLSHEWQLAAPLADRVEWQLYRQDSETTQDTDERRVTAAPANALQRRQRTFNFDQRVVGVDGVAFKEFTWGATGHALTYGIEYTDTRTRQKRDGLLTQLATGVQSPVMPPDVFPVRDFPNSTTREAAVFVQDEMRFADGVLRVVPAVRVDRYALRPDVDAIFAGDNPGVAVSDLTDTHVSPKLGVVWTFAPDWSVFGGVSRGFRAPPYNDVNIGFTNVAFGYTAIANPDLRPETSTGLELGLRWVNEVAYASLAAYDNRYDDFIESMRLVGIDAQGLAVFQSQNVARARIRGAEFKAGVDLGQTADALTGWSLRGAAAYARGEDRDSGAPLAGIDPLRGSLGLAYEHGAWGAELAAAFARRQSRLPSATQYAPAGYGVLDLFAHWRFAPGARLDVGVANLTDKRYTDSADVPGVSATSSVLDRYTRAGRNLSASLTVQW